MNRTSVLTVATFTVALLGAGAAFAQEATSDAWMKASLSKSRAQVQAELMQARQDGTIKSTELGYIEPLRASVDRGTVRAETMAALRSGELAALGAEAHVFVQPRGATLFAGN